MTALAFFVQTTQNHLIHGRVVCHRARPFSLCHAAGGTEARVPVTRPTRTRLSSCLRKFNGYGEILLNCSPPSVAMNEAAPRDFHVFPEKVPPTPAADERPSRTVHARVVAENEMGPYRHPEQHGPASFSLTMSEYVVLRGVRCRESVVWGHFF